MAESDGYTAKHGSRLAAVLFYLLLILAVLTACASFTWPYGWDQGIFAWVGDVIYRGGLPYRDGWDIKGPLVYYVYALAEWLFGRQTWSIRIIDLVFLGLSCAVLYRMLSAWTDCTVAVWATLLFVLWYASGSYWHTAQPDGWVMMLMIPVASMLFQQKRKAGWIAWLLAGLLIGCAALVKFLYAGFLLVPAVVAFADRRRPGEISICALVCGAGFAVPVLLAVLWFWHHDALDTFIEVTMRYPAETYSMLVQQGVESRLRGLIEYLASGTGMAVILPFVIFGLFVAWQRAPVLAMGLAAWIFAAMTVVVLQNRFFTYHWLPLIPALVISVAFGMHALFRGLWSGEERPRHTSRLQGLLAGSLLAVFVFHVSALPAFEVLHWGAYLAGQQSAYAYQRHFGSPADDLAMAELVRTTTDEHDHVAIFGWNSAILFLSGRRSPSRFGFSMPLMQGTGESHWLTAYRNEFMQALYRKRPAAIVVGTQSDQLLGATVTLSDFPELGDFIDRNYNNGQQVGALTLYLKRPM